MYALYGLKVIIFQAARELRTDYTTTFLATIRAKQPRGLAPKKVPTLLSSIKSRGGTDLLVSQIHNLLR